MVKKQQWGESPHTMPFSLSVKREFLALKWVVQLDQGQQSNINYMAKKTKLEKMADAIMDWVEEDKDNRAFICFYGDRKGGYTSSGAHGKEPDIAESIVNEMLEDKELAYLLKKSVEIYEEVLKEEKRQEQKTNEEKPKTKLPKRMLS